MAHRSSSIPSRVSFLIITVACAGSTRGVIDQQPHVVVVIGDDVGWANVGWHNPAPPNRNDWYVRTPHMDELVEQGVVLERMYAFKSCGPSRSSFLTG